MTSKLSMKLIVAATIGGWLALLLNASPWIELHDAHRVFAAVVAISGTVSLAVLAASRPVREVYELGRAAGQREAKIEQSTRAVTRTVVPFRSHRSGRGRSQLG